MRTKCSSIHWQTPALKVRDSRQLTVREVRYLRSAESVEAQPLVTRQQYNPAGHQVEQRDPRLFDASTPANVATVYSLSAHPLMIDSVDAGWRLNLPGMAGQALERWDRRGNHWQSCFDEQLRVLSEATADSGHLETRNYADASADSGHNLCGQMTTLKDTSGSLNFQSFALLGQPLEQTRTFADSQSHTSRQSFGSLNQLLTQTDAGGHRQTFSYDVAGQVAQISLQRQGSEPQSILQRAQYNAHGQIIERLAANHVVSQWLYDPANDWLLSAQAGVAGQPLLQNFEYAYDAVGNVLRIDDSTFTPVYFANQYIDGHRAFSYDSLDRLITASGHDAAPASEIPGRPSPSDPNNLRNYTQHFEYDVAANLIKQVHERATGGYTRQMQVAPSSNRALPWQADDPPPDFATAFDAHGNLLSLRHGPQLAWNALDQLRQITLLKRNNALADDQEAYPNALKPTASAHHIFNRCVTCRGWKSAPATAAKNCTSSSCPTTCVACIGVARHRRTSRTINCVTASVITWVPARPNLMNRRECSVRKPTIRSAAPRFGYPIPKARGITKPFVIRARRWMSAACITTVRGITHPGCSAG
jgi:insecticidal toxin complex protein TccC